MSVLEHVEALVTKLRGGGDGLTDSGEAKAAMALRLAESLDESPPMAAAALAKQLSATLDDLTGGSDGGADEFFSAAELSTPVQHTP